MKILFLTSNLKKIGGIERYNKNLFKALNELKENVLIVELKKSNRFFKFVFILEFIIKILIFNPKIIFCGHINFSLPVYFAKKLFKNDYIIFTHGIDVWDIKSNLKLKSLENAKLVISVSRYTADKLNQQNSNLKNKIYLLPNTINGEKFYPEKKSAELLLKHNLSQDDKIILTVARLSANEKYKGCDQIIESLPLIIKKIPEARYVIVGTGDDLDRIKNLVKKLNLEKYVIFISKALELIDYYNLCDVFAMPSKGEGFGIVFLEAMACGKPVIAGNRDGSKDAVLDGELGILVNPDNLEEIAESIIKVFKKEVSGKLLDGQYLRKKVLEVYGFDKFREKVKNLLYVLSR